MSIFVDLELSQSYEEHYVHHDDIDHSEQNDEETNECSEGMVLFGFVMHMIISKLIKTTHPPQQSQLIANRKTK